VGGASSRRAIDPSIGAYSSESFSTPNHPVNHILVVTEELVTHIVAPFFFGEKIDGAR
jgi:hypothetical protein